MGKKFPDASGRTQSGLPMNNRLAMSTCKKFCILVGTARCAVQTSRRGVLSLGCIFSGYGVGVCSPPAAPLAEGVALGCSLPDSIMVGRTGPIASSFAFRELDRAGLLVCTARVSFFTRVGGCETAGGGAAAPSEGEGPAL